MPNKKRRVAILALEGFVPFDLCIPHALFSMAVLPDGSSPYETCFCGPAAKASSGGFSVECDLPLRMLPNVDTIVVPGLLTALEYRNEELFAVLRRAADNGARIASICTGAWVLAASGLLDGLRATTHWEVAERMAQAYPTVVVDPDVLFVDNGRILTSAGLSAGIDLCLHMIRKDCGAAAAERCAEFFVLPIERGGGHPQIIRRGAPQDAGSLAALQSWLLENLHAELTLRDITDRACMSGRTLNRKFKEQTGLSPMAWLTGARVRRAQSLLESTSMPVEQVAAATGFGSAQALREAFRRSVGVSPSAWRGTYGSRTVGGGGDPHPLHTAG